MEKLNIYISSTFRDMKGIREGIMERVHEGLNKDYELTTIMEYMTGDFKNEGIADQCRNEVMKANLYILLIGDRYGSPAPYYKDKNDARVENTDGLSYTELEFDAAVEMLSEKFYGIIKLDVSALVTGYSDLHEEGKAYKHANFINKIGTTIKINSPEELVTTLNNKYFEFKHEQIRLIKFSGDLTTINRNTQMKILDELKFTIGSSSNCVVLTSGYEDPKDCYEEFTKRARNEILKSRIDKMLHFISDDQSYSAHETNTAKLILFRQCTIGIEGWTPLLPLAKLSEKIDKSGQHAFVGFVIESYSKRVIEIISGLINDINVALKNAESYYNFYFIIYIRSSEYNNSITHLNALLTQYCIEHHDLDKLGKVQREDVLDWFHQNLVNTGFDGDPKNEANTLYRLIFKDENFTDRHYKEYLNIIEIRTKM
ncbi:DUF4062 domain-containing protein [Flavobacterium tructae]|uniref:DUF4062 domain-containing protein n=1 Tax=Flavobacterium tructae TaxID=1114873 RepID=UPI0035A97709